MTLTPEFHVSLFWILGDHQELIETNLKLTKKVDDVIGEFFGGLDGHLHYQTVEKLVFKSGHKHFHIPLCRNSIY